MNDVLMRTRDCCVKLMPQRVLRLHHSALCVWRSKAPAALDAASPVAGLNAAICPCQAPPLTPQKVSQRGGGPRSSPVSCSVTLTCTRPHVLILTPLLHHVHVLTLHFVLATILTLTPKLGSQDKLNPLYESTTGLPN
jgi:hypothetical protein